MKIIYIFRNNHYAAILAAYIHLKMNIPSSKMKYQSIEKMRLYYMGLDHHGREVYLLKYRMKKHILMNILVGIGNIFNEEVSIVELEKIDGLVNHIRYKYNINHCRKEVEDFIYENNL